jgi:hypothetical protein
MAYRRGAQMAAAPAHPQDLPDSSEAASPQQLNEAFYSSTGRLMFDSLRFGGPLLSPHDAAIAALALPAALALLLEPLQALVDTAIVGTLGVTSLGAVGLGTVVFQFVLGELQLILAPRNTVLSSVP